MYYFEENYLSWSRLICSRFIGRRAAGNFENMEENLMKEEISKGGRRVLREYQYYLSKTFLHKPNHSGKKIGRGICWRNEMGWPDGFRLIGNQYTK